MEHTVVAWIFALMSFLAPPEKLTAAPHVQLPGWEETLEQRTERYESIAKDIFEVVYDVSAKLPYRGKRGRAQSTALLVAIAFMESGFMPDVDKGPCYRKGSFRTRCDGGLSAGMWQARLGEGETLLSIHGVDGLKQADLFKDRKTQVRIALHMVNRSFKTCRLLGPEAVLNVYSSGSCSRGQKPASARLALAKRAYAARPPTWKEDKEFVIVPLTAATGSGTAASATAP